MNREVQAVEDVVFDNKTLRQLEDQEAANPLPPCDVGNNFTEDELIRRMTAAMREADATFELVGGSTRHHIRDCLLPILDKHGLSLALKRTTP